MKLLVVLAALAVTVAAQTSDQKPAPKGAQGATPKHAYLADDMKYGPPPPFIPAGATMAVLEGDPMANTGDYTLRVKMPDGYQIGPHWHPKRENVTVISGTLAFGMGDKFDESKMKPYSAGGFVYLDPSMHHYVKARGETVVQIHGMSPVQFNYINPSDDPRNKK